MMKVSKCKSCQAPVIWTVTRSGKKMPVDAKTIKGFWLDDDFGQVSANAVELHQSHFVTCPNADQHRKS